jgi:hypothetical protein
MDRSTNYSRSAFDILGITGILPFAGVLMRGGEMRDAALVAKYNHCLLLRIAATSLAITARNSCFALLSSH